MTVIFEAKLPNKQFVVIKSREGYHVEQRDSCGVCVQSTIRFEEPKRAVQIALNWVKYGIEIFDIDEFLEPETDNDGIPL